VTATASAAPAAVPARSRSGVAIAAACFTLWGLYPFYFRELATVGPFEIVAHRIVWSAAFLACLMPFRGRARELVATLRDRRRMATLALTSAIILANWFVYVLAVVSGQVLDASLGYFLGPLVSVCLGVAVLRERLSRMQAAATALAAFAVLNLMWQFGMVPKIALFLGISFSVYGLIRKRLPVSPVTGLFVECLLAVPVALGTFLWIGSTTGLAFGHQGAWIDLLLLASGVATAGPLLLFNLGAKRVDYATIGVMQYIAPSMLFLESVLIFGEPLAFWRLATFVLIWAALAMYTGDALLRTREARRG
jgi:chloramphenicol-sensitive protein RarD